MNPQQAHHQPQQHTVHPSSQPQQPQILLSTCPDITGYKIVRSLGLVRGSTVRAKNFFRDWVAAFRSIIGGEITEYTKLQADAREQALKRMVFEAMHLQANAIVNIRIDTSMIMAGACEIILYGTAVQLELQN